MHPPGRQVEPRHFHTGQAAHGFLDLAQTACTSGAAYEKLDLAAPLAMRDERRHISRACLGLGRSKARRTPDGREVCRQIAVPHGTISVL